MNKWGQLHGIQISWPLNFSKTTITRTKSRFPWICFTVILPPIHNIPRTPDFSNQFSFPWRFEKSGFHCMYTTNTLFSEWSNLLLIQLTCSPAGWDLDCAEIIWGLIHGGANEIKWQTVTCQLKKIAHQAMLWDNKQYKIYVVN